MTRPTACLAVTTGSCPLSQSARSQPSWLAALRPNGRLVTTITGTNLIVTADKTPDGGAYGVTEWDRAGFMPTRIGPDYPPGVLERFAALRDAAGEHVSTGRYPVVNVAEAWELYSTLGVSVPGVQHHYTEMSGAGQLTAWMLHPDGSWARATSTGDKPACGPPIRSAPPVGHPGRPTPDLAPGRFTARLRGQGHHHPRRHSPPQRGRWQATSLLAASQSARSRARRSPSAVGGRG